MIRKAAAEIHVTISLSKHGGATPIPPRQVTGVVVTHIANSGIMTKANFFQVRNTCGCVKKKMKSTNPTGSNPKSGKAILSKRSIQV